MSFTKALGKKKKIKKKNETVYTVRNYLPCLMTFANVEMFSPEGGDTFFELFLEFPSSLLHPYW